MSLPQDTLGRKMENEVIRGDVGSMEMTSNGHKKLEHSGSDSVDLGHIAVRIISKRKIVEQSRNIMKSKSKVDVN